MKLATWIPPGGGAPVSGEIRGEEAVAFASGTVLDRLASGDREPGTGTPVPLGDVELLAPVARPGAIFCIGLNYADHIAETGMETPQFPIVFLKPPGAAAAPGADVPVPRIVRRLDYEGELTIVMGARGEIAGYAIADDVSARDLQGREPQWTRAKGADGFCPFGPWITTVDEVPDPRALSLRTWVNGDLRQDSSTSNLVWGPDELVRFVGETCTLSPGDLILTGTPGGVGMALDPPQFLQSGDVVRIEIGHLGAIEHAIA
jgi:acylpyruvate hydrolase